MNFLIMLLFLFLIYLGFIYLGNFWELKKKISQRSLTLKELVQILLLSLKSIGILLMRLLRKLKKI